VAPPPSPEYCVVWALCNPEERREGRIALIYLCSVRSPIKSPKDHKRRLVADTLGTRIPSRVHQWMVESGTPDSAVCCVCTKRIHVEQRSAQRTPSQYRCRLRQKNGVPSALQGAERGAATPPRREHSIGPHSRKTTRRQSPSGPHPTCCPHTRGKRCSRTCRLR
jgi:hypothetical protein